MSLSLTRDQAAAASHQEGPCLVLAGPGSGKTRVLVARLARLLAAGVPPEGLLAITFTRAAADEMRSRLAGQVGAPARQVGLYTFHGLAYRMLRLAGPVPRILREQEQAQILRPLLREAHLPTDTLALEALTTDLTRYAGDLAPEDFTPAACSRERFFALRTAYQRAKLRLRAWDFDDLLTRSWELLRESDRWRNAWQRRLQHILVDEFQDTNRVQWEILQLLSRPPYNLFCVGDEDQAVYGWRGARPDFLLQFPQAYPGARILHLRENFRSLEALVRPAARLVGQNRSRFAKELRAARPGGRGPQLWQPPDLRGAYSDLIAHLQEAQRQGAAGRWAVLYRTHHQAFGLIARLEEAGLPVHILGGRPNPFQRWMARDLLAYLRAAWGEATLPEWQRLLRRPVWPGLSQEVVGELAAHRLRPDQVLPWLQVNGPHPAARRAAELQELLARLRETPAGGVVAFVLDQLEYRRYIDQYCAWSGADRREALAHLAALGEMADPAAPGRALLEMADGGWQRDETGADRPRADAITLSTFHRAKGLEWDGVVVWEALEGLTPHDSALAGGPALEEERRLFYVAITRARQELILVVPQTLGMDRAEPSRFLSEMGLLPPGFAPGRVAPA